MSMGGIVVFFFFFKQKTAYEMQRGLVGSEMCIRDRYMGTGSDYCTLYYRKIWASGVVTIEWELFKGLSHGFTSDITGASDGSHIYIVANVKRSSDSEYYDIFFTESSDGGVIFTNPIQVPRQDLNDKINRYYGNIQYSRMAGHLWIFYFVSSSLTSKGNLAFVTRKRGSTKLETENQFYSATLSSPLKYCLLYTSPSPRDLSTSRMPSSA
eukprot:TRINITY_DN10812_c0_g2_i1.p1 TRINITY_DN10812_c0_g2~~TRINITY_DN10812_c0_g2_i1.p1  ORF type:complete len:211 (-),score=38.66 TRINITY_DN10812_c0_g2_i1:103-735(-)